jgi:hypothetical protein
MILAGRTPAPYAIYLVNHAVPKPPGVESAFTACWFRYERLAHFISTNSFTEEKGFE